MNTTSDQLVIQDDFNQYEEPTKSLIKFGLVLCVLFIQVFGNGLCSSIIAYERYGGDPQKRTILNQLFSNLAFNVIVLNVIPLNVFTLRLIFGPIMSPFVAKMCFFIPKVSIGFASLLLLNEMIVIRFISVFVWKRIPPVNDYFLFAALNVTNGVLAVYFGLSVNMGTNIENDMKLLLTGLTDSNDENIPTIR
jgi:hypothetical protein